MRQRKGKPSRRDWGMAAALIVSGALLQMSVFPEVLRVRLAPALLGSGICVLLILWRSAEVYADLPLEEQKELDRQDRDERNQMILEKTAWRCWQGETVVLAVAYIFLALFLEKIPVLNQLDYRIFSLALTAYWVRILIFELVRWLMQRKY